MGDYERLLFGVMVHGVGKFWKETHQNKCPEGNLLKRVVCGVWLSAGERKDDL